MKKVVITGATSMIGCATINECLKNGIEVYAVVRKNSPNTHRLLQDSRLHIVECDLSDICTLSEKISEECDTFYHFAWGHTGEGRNLDCLYQVDNIRFSIEAIREAKKLGCRQFIGSGSQAEYGNSGLDKISPDSPVNPQTAYGIAKYATCQLLLQEAKRLEIDIAWVRVFSVFGKFDKESTMISQLISNLKKGQRMKLTPCENTWDYLFSEDAGRAFRLIGEKSEGSKIYCLGSGKPRVLKDYILAARDIINPGAEVGIGDIDYKGPKLNLCADISSLTRCTGFIPEISFEDGIKRLAE